MNLNDLPPESGLVTFVIEGKTYWQVVWNGLLRGQKHAEEVDAVIYLTKLTSELRVV